MYLRIVVNKTEIDGTFRVRAMKKIIVLFSVLTLSAIWAVPAAASTVTFEFDTPLPTMINPDGAAPWLTAVFVDIDPNTPGAVYLTLTANLINSNFISGVYINLDPNIEPSDLSASVIGTATADPITYSKGTNAFKADGDGYFDFLISFTESNSENRFEGTDSITFLLEAPGLLASSFEFYSAPGGGNGTWLSIAHIQGIGTNNDDSSWVGGTIPTIPAPIPPAVWLLGSGLIGLVGLRRKLPL